MQYVKLLSINLNLCVSFFVLLQTAIKNIVLLREHTHYPNTSDQESANVFIVELFKCVLIHQIDGDKVENTWQHQFENLLPFESRKVMNNAIAFIPKSVSPSC